MQHLTTHPAGPAFSRLIAGAWRWHTVATEMVDRLIHTALDLGITTFDHADIYGDYGNEKIFGDSVRRNPHLANKLQSVTKCGIKLLSSKKPDHWIKHYDNSKAHVVASAESSLRLLGLGHIDLLLIHRPNPVMDVDELADAFTTLKQGGKVLHFGVSNFTPSQFDLLQSVLPFPLATNQIELSLFNNSPLFDGTLDHLYRVNTSAMAWSPLGGGKPFSDHDHHQVMNGLRDLTLKYNGATEAQLLLSWLLYHPSSIFPVVGTTKPERLLEAAKSVNIRLETQDWFLMLKIARGRDVA